MKMNNKTKKTVFSVTITLVLLALIGLIIYYCSCKNGKEGFDETTTTNAEVECGDLSVDDWSEENWQTSCQKDKNCIQYWDNNTYTEKCVKVEDVPCDMIYDKEKCGTKTECAYEGNNCRFSTFPTGKSCGNFDNYDECNKYKGCVSYLGNDNQKDICTKVEDATCDMIGNNKEQCATKPTTECVYEGNNCRFPTLPEGKSCGNFDNYDDCNKYKGCVSYWDNDNQKDICTNVEDASCDKIYDETQCNEQKNDDGISARCEYKKMNEEDGWGYCLSVNEEIPCNNYYDNPTATRDGSNPCPTDRCVYEDTMCKIKLSEGEKCEDKTAQDCWKYQGCVSYWDDNKCYDKESAPCYAFYDDKTNCPTDRLTDKCEYKKIKDTDYSGYCLSENEEIPCNNYYNPPGSTDDYDASCPIDRCNWEIDSYGNSYCKNKPTTTTQGQVGTTTTQGQVGTTTTKGQVGTTTTKAQVGTTTTTNGATTTKGQDGTTTTKGQVGTTTTQPPIKSVEEIVEDMKPAETAPLEEKQEYTKMKQNLEKVKRKVKPENVKVVEEKMKSFIPNQKKQVVKTLSTLDDTQATNLNTTLPQLDEPKQQELMKVFAIPDYKQQVLTVLKDTSKTPAERKQQIVKILEKSSKDPTIQKMFVTKTVTVPVRMPQDPTPKYRQQQPSWRNNNRRNERTMTGRQVSNYNTRNSILSQTPSNVNKGVSVSNYEGVLNIFYPYMM